MKQISKREKTYVVIFLLALVWGAWNYRHLFMSTDETTSANSTPVAALTAPAPAKHAAVAVRPAVATNDTYQSPPWSSDPFHRAWRGTVVTAATVRNKPLPLTLSAVVMRSNAKYAVINGKIVREGQQIAGRTVTRIEEARVVLNDHGVEVILSL